MAIKIKKSTKKKAAVLAGTLIAGTGLGIGAYALAYRKGWIDDPDQDPVGGTETNNYSSIANSHENFLTEGSLG